MFNSGDRVVYFGNYYKNLVSGKTYTVTCVFINTETKVESLLLKGVNSNNSYLSFYFLSENKFRKEKLEKLKTIQ